MWIPQQNFGVNKGDYLDSSSSQFGLVKKKNG